MTVLTILQRPYALLLSHPGENAAWLAEAIECCAHDEARCYRVLNSKRRWGGAGSVANAVLADNPVCEQCRRRDG
jgi:hypothetical protein